ncbi:hypothetical protein [Mycobacterium asiaticum]|uniref:Uncharacterized protein n=1 Tax=Mycobacterium asiaticum TaxID=1790 RepID=A0A1A3NK62_MYCAS|nr:hypothetical protein [Mycobacterium asiaticum]OBK22528.1 hypothetical protein A5635_21670 [Mycobacterium asiaticum]
MSLPAEYQHPAEHHPALRGARNALRHFDTDRDLHERRDRVHHLTRIGLSDDQIAARLDITDRTVVRHRGKPPAPQRPRLYDGARVTDERARQLEDTADFALHLATVLRDEDPTVVWGSLCRLDRRQLQELAAVALAAIPVDMTRDELLAWVNQLPAAKAGPA